MNKSLNNYLGYFALLIIFMVSTGCRDHAEFDINDFRAQAPTRGLTNVYTQVQFFFDNDVNAECGGFCEEAPDSEVSFTLDLELTSSPTGATVEYISPDLQSDYTLSYVRTFFFKTDTPGTYVFNITLAGSLTITDNNNSDSDSYTGTVTVEVDENTDSSFLTISQTFETGDDVASDVTSSFYDEMWSLTNDGFETEAYLLSADDDVNLLFDLVEYDAGDDSTMVPSLTIGSTTYHLPFMVMGNSLEYFGYVGFTDTDDDGIDEFYFVPYCYKHPSYYGSNGEQYFDDWYDLFDSFYENFAAQLEVTP